MGLEEEAEPPKQINHKPDILEKVRNMPKYLRIIDVFMQNVQDIIHLALKVVVMEVMCERLPPAHIHQVADKLVKALQLGRGESTNTNDVRLTANNIHTLIKASTFCWGKVYK